MQIGDIIVIYIPLETDTKIILKGSGYFQFPEAVLLLLQRKIRSTKWGSLHKLSLFYRCTTVTNVGSEGKPVL